MHKEDGWGSSAFSGSFDYAFMLGTGAAGLRSYLADFNVE